MPPTLSCAAGRVSWPPVHLPPAEGEHREKGKHIPSPQTTTLIIHTHIHMHIHTHIHKHMNTILHVIYIHVCIFMIKLMVHKNKIKNTGPCPILNKIHSETACLYTNCRHRISIACQCSPHSLAIFHYTNQCSPHSLVPIPLHYSCTPHSLVPIPLHYSVHSTLTSPYTTTLFVHSTLTSPYTTTLFSALHTH